MVDCSVFIASALERYFFDYLLLVTYGFLFLWFYILLIRAGSGLLTLCGHWFEGLFTQKRVFPSLIMNFINALALNCEGSSD